MSMNNFQSDFMNENNVYFFISSFFGFLLIFLDLSINNKSLSYREEFLNQKILEKNKTIDEY
jgi:hypothetical protein